MDILTYLQGQGRHSIDVLLAIYTLTQQKQKEQKIEEVRISWKDVESWIKQNISNISDGTYRARRQELLEMGLVELDRIDALRSNVKITAKGMTIASLIKEFADAIKRVEETEK